VDLKGPHRELAIARGRWLRCRFCRPGLSSRGTEQEFQRAQIVFILDLAHNLFKDVLQRDESQNPRVVLTHQSHGTVGLEKQLQRRGHVIVGLQEAGWIPLTIPAWRRDGNQH
jgi:hypothetical protein